MSRRCASPSATASDQSGASQPRSHGRQRHLWIDALEFLGVVRVGIEIDEHDLGRQLLQIERDTNAKTRLRSPEGEEFHRGEPRILVMPGLDPRASGTVYA